MINVDEIMIIEIQDRDSLNKINAMLKANWRIIETNKREGKISVLLGHVRNPY